MTALKEGFLYPESPMLSWIIFIPLIGAGIILLLPKENKFAIRGVALLATLVDFALCFPLYFGFD
jgi:NADH-quinone oxidoreductase subunit M